MRPYPKAGPRKGSKQSNGRKRSTAILTDTPEKDKLEKEKTATDAKKNKLAKVRRKLVPHPTTVTKTAGKKSRRRAAKDNQDPTRVGGFYVLIVHSCDNKWPFLFVIFKIGMYR